MDEKNKHVHITKIKNELDDREIGYHRDRDKGGVKNRRKKQADWVVNTAAILSLISWLVSFAVLAVLDVASPEKSNFFTNVFNGDVRRTWDETLIPAAFILLLVSLFACGAAFIFNMMRMRRKTDKYRKSIIIIGLANIIGLIIFSVRFSGAIF